MFMGLMWVAMGAWAQGGGVEVKEVVTVNSSLLDNIQLLHPSFFYSDDSAVLRKNLEKNYLSYKVRSQDPVRNELEQDSAVMRQRREFLKMADELFWATIIEQRGAESQDTLTEVQIMAYYDTHKSEYLEPLSFTYWQAWVQSDDTAVLEQARLKMLELAGAQNAQKYMGEQYAINLEPDQELPTDHPLFGLLQSAAIQKVSGPVRVDSTFVMVYLTERSGGSPLPFEQVRDRCRQALDNKTAQEKALKAQEKISGGYVIEVQK